jgi:hypothetical protein
MGAGDGAVIGGVRSPLQHSWGGFMMRSTDGDTPPPRRSALPPPPRLARPKSIVAGSAAKFLRCPATAPHFRCSQIPPLTTIQLVPSNFTIVPWST